MPRTGPAAALALVLASGCDVDWTKLVPFLGPSPAPAASAPRRRRGRVKSSSLAPAAPSAPAASGAPAASVPVSSSAPAASSARPVVCTPAPAASGLRSSQGPRGGGEASEERFAFEDERYLMPGQKEGGLVYVPAAVPAGATVPLVIFLHGTNASGPLHRGLGSGAGLLTSSNEIEAGYDLRPVVQEMIDRGAITPVMVGGPSQTRDAGKGHDLWLSFDPAAFVDAAERSLGDRARVDRERVVVVGHSGAGCSPVGGGLVGVAQRLGASSESAPPHALVAIDTCLDDFVGDAFAAASQVTAVWVYFQTASWERPFDAFTARFLPDEGDIPAGDPERRRVVEVEGLSGDAAHNLALPRSLRLALPALLPPRLCP